MKSWGSFASDNDGVMGIYNCFKNKKYKYMMKSDLATFIKKKKKKTKMRDYEDMSRPK